MRLALRHWENRRPWITRRSSFWVYVVMLVSITLLHYCNPQVTALQGYPLTRHAVVRILFILPVAGATFVFGRGTGLLTLVLVIAIMLPRVFFISVSPVDALLEVVATTIAGYLVVLMLESFRRTVSRMETINRVNAALTGSLELKQILTNVLYTLLDVMNVKAGVVYLVDEDEQGLTMVAQRNLPPELTENVSGLKSARMIVHYQGFKCRLAVPLCSKGKTNGLLIMGNATPCPAMQREKELVNSICNTIDVVVENARLYEGIARQLQIERSVLEVVREITSELELSRILPKIIEIAERLAGADGGVVALWDEERDVVTYPYLHNLPQRLADVEVSRKEGLSAEVMVTGCPIVIDHYPTYARAIPAFVEAGVISIVGVPILSGERVFGTMCVVSIGGAKSFLDRDIAILTGIGRQAGIAVENARLYENLRFYARQITQAQENERKRIARELHDDTIQSLIALSRRLEGLVKSDERLPDAAAQRIQALWQETGDAIRRVRRFSQDLRPSILDDLGLLPTLEELTTDLNRETGLRAGFRVRGTKQRFSSEVELTLFRIAQEALTNVRKHAQATEVTTTVELANSAVKMTVQDNGRGFMPPILTEAPENTDMLGLIGMNERVRLLGGTLLIESQPDQGTSVIVNVPI